MLFIYEFELNKNVPFKRESIFSSGLKSLYIVLNNFYSYESLIQHKFRLLISQDYKEGSFPELSWPFTWFVRTMDHANSFLKKSLCNKQGFVQCVFVVTVYFCYHLSEIVFMKKKYIYIYVIKNISSSWTKKKNWWSIQTEDKCASNTISPHVS